MLGAVIFDFDGVIADSEVLHFRAFNEALAPHSVEISIENYYKDYLGLSDIDLLTQLVDEGRLKLDADQIKELVKQKQLTFEELVKADCRIIDGVRNFLEMLRQNNVPMAIYSGAILSEIEMILQQAGLLSFFEVIVSAEQVEKGKPDAEGFLLALEKLNEKSPKPISPRECIVVEDSHWGLEAAKAAQMHAIAVTNSYDADQLTMAEKTVTRLDELTMEDLQQLCR